MSKYVEIRTLNNATHSSVIVNLERVVSVEIKTRDDDGALLSVGVHMEGGALHRFDNYSEKSLSADDFLKAFRGHAGLKTA